MVEQSGRATGATFRFIRTVVVAALLMWLASMWVQRAALITLAAQIGMAVPPVPALLGLLLLLGYQRLTKGRPWLHLTLAEVLGVYAIMCLATAMVSGGALRFFLPSLTALRYFAAPENNFGQMAELLPQWFAPTDGEVARAYYEGAEDGGVPWGAWALPLAIWTGYFVAFMAALLCLALLFFRPWTEDERLRFPIVELPLEIAGVARRVVARPPLFKDHWLWVGVGLAGLFNLLNILHSFNPSVPALPQAIPLRAVFREGPLSRIWWLDIQVQPLILGFAYLMPTEILFSMLVFVSLALAENVGLDLLGYKIAGAPYEVEQYAGAQVAIAAALVYTARRRLARAFAGIARGRGEPESRALLGFLLCAGFVLCFHWLAGLPLWLALVFYALLFVFSLVCMRIRAEVGIPTTWLQPLEMAFYLPLAPRGSAPFGARALTLLASMTFLTRGYFPVLSAYEIEGLRLGRAVGIGTARMSRVLMAAALLGLACGFWLHLSAYYEYGANVLEGGTTEGGYRVQLTLRNFTLVSNALKSPYPSAPIKMWMAAAGFAQAGALVLVRRILVTCPLHPLGFALGIVWTRQNYAMVGLAWLCKVLILKFGGLRAYHRILPLFLGIALGHVVLAGGLWALISTYGGEVFRQYVVWFQ